jgi:hypothetical protein
VLQVMLRLREAMPAISLALPAIEPMVKGPAWTERWNAARPHRSCPAVGACDRSAIRLVHATVGVLSNQTPAQTNRRSTFCWRTI